MPSPSKSPRHSLSDRLQRSRRHRHWANTQIDSASVGGGSVSSTGTGNVSVASEPPQDQSSAGRIKNKVAHSLANSDDASVNSTFSTPSPEKQSLASRRQRAMKLGRKHWQNPQSTSPKAAGVAPNPTTARPPVMKTQAPSEPQERQFRSPAKQPSSPCESMLYQASAMESPDGNDYATEEELVLSQPPKRATQVPRTAPTPSAQPQVRPMPFDRSGVASSSAQRTTPYSAGKEGQRPPSAYASAVSSFNKRNSTGRAPSPRHAEVAPGKTINPTPLSRQDELVEHSAVVEEENVKSAYGAVIETPKVASVASLRASFNSRGSKQPIMPMNSSDPRVRHSLPMAHAQHHQNGESEKEFSESPVLGDNVDSRMHWKSRSLPQRNTMPKTEVSGRRSWVRPAAPDSAPMAQPAPTSRSDVVILPSKNPHSSHSIPRQSRETEEETVQHSAHNSWQNKTRQNEGERKSTRAPWQKDLKVRVEESQPKLRPSWMKRLENHYESPATAGVEDQLSPMKSISPNNRSHHSEQRSSATTEPHLGPKRQEGKKWNSHSTLPPAVLPQKERQPLPPVILPQKERPKALAPVILPQKERQPLPPVILPEKERPKLLAPVILPQRERQTLPPVILPQKERPTPLPPAILPQTDLSKKDFPQAILPILPQKERPKPLAPVILPQKERLKPLPPAILPQTDLPKKDLPQAILPTTTPKSEVLPSFTSSQNKEAHEEYVIPTQEGSTLELTDGMAMQNTGDLSLGPNPVTDHQAAQKQITRPPTYRPPSQSVQSKKSPWQKWSEQHSNHNNKDAQPKTQSHENEWVSSQDEFILEEEKSGDIGPVSVNEEELLDTAADEALEAHHTHLARMAADSTLVADYEEALKQASQQLSYDEEDSYISSGFTGNSSAIPQDLPLEFQQALEKSPMSAVGDQLGQPSLLSEVEEDQIPPHLNMKQSDDESVYIEDGEGFKTTRSLVDAEEERQVQNRLDNLTVDVGDSLEDSEERSPTTYIEDGEGFKTTRSLEDAEEERQVKNRLDNLTVDVGDSLEDSEERSPTTPGAASRYPILTPSPRDSDAYRMVYFGDKSPAAYRGKSRRQSSPGSGMERGESSSLQQQGSPMLNGYGSSPGFEESSRDASSKGQTSTLQGSYPDEMLDSVRSSDFDPNYPDPDMLELHSDVESDEIFDNPRRLGAGGGGGGGGGGEVSATNLAKVHGQEMKGEHGRLSRLSPERNNAAASHILKFWASGAASEEEQEEAVTFDEADQWHDRDPDLDGFRDDASLSPETKEKPKVEATPRGDVHELDMQKEWRYSSPTKRGVAGFNLAEPVTPSSAAWTTHSDFGSATAAKDLKGQKSKRKKTRKAKEVFDPFGDTDDLTIANSGHLFSPLPDPFMTEESFSPPDWNTPRGQVKYYSTQSPDWHQGVEI